MVCNPVKNEMTKAVAKDKLAKSYINIDVINVSLYGFDFYGHLFTLFVPKDLNGQPHVNIGTVSHNFASTRGHFQAS